MCITFILNNATSNPLAHPNVQLHLGLVDIYTPTYIISPTRGILFRVFVLVVYPIAYVSVDCTDCTYMLWTYGYFPCL